MSEVYCLEITSNVNEFPYEKKYQATMLLGDLKKKLELVVGAIADQMSIELRDSEGKFVTQLTDDKKNLRDSGVRDGMKIYAVDNSGQNLDLNDGDMVEKYEISEDDYNRREDSVRIFKKKMLQAQSGVVPPAAEDPNEIAAQEIKVGDRCEVRVKGQMSRRGQVAFVGLTQFQKGYWAGIKYDEPVGKNDGSVAGVRYFTCDNLSGGFVRPVDVHVGDYAELPIEDDMDEI